MKSGTYRLDGNRTGRSKRPIILLVIITFVALALGFAAYRLFAQDPVQKAASQLQFDDSVSENEKLIIRDSIQAQSKTYDGSLTVSVHTSKEASSPNAIISAYVPVTHIYAARQSINTDEISKTTLYIPAGTDQKIRAAVATTLGVDNSKLADMPASLDKLSDTAIAFIPANELSDKVKLLYFDDAYYLDSFNKGAVFRQARYSDDSNVLADLKLNDLATKDTVLKVNMTGVTALTRVMQKKLSSVKDPLYFSEKIGDFLADADITHVSNEVSFRNGCQYSNTLFCSPPEFIETLKDSGVDLVELTGNHNNDNGNAFNTESIELYRSLGWNTVGGGLNTADAAKPYVADKKGNKITFLGYNMADSAGSGAIAGTTTAGANIFTEEKAKSDIAAAKQNSQFVVVNIQYAECQAYPAGYVEFPECDGTIGGQEQAFRNMIDWGADMVIGSSAHQPQTYEIYKDKPIYYGLGNLYFEQTQWPGTERGIILTHYFIGGKLIQTKLSPTVYDRDFQTRLMGTDEAVKLLQRLDAARP